VGQSSPLETWQRRCLALFPPLLRIFKRVDSSLLSQVRTARSIMASTVAKLDHHMGEPLPPSTHPATTFSSLPLEIRDKIYALLLISPEPLLVYKKRGNSLQEGEPQEPHATYANLAHLVTLGLLLVNRRLSIEAAKNFYHHNIFIIGGTRQLSLRDPWGPLYSFLTAIGDKNRSYLQFLEVEIATLKQLPTDGHRIISSRLNEYMYSSMREICVPDRYARINQPGYGEGRPGPAPSAKTEVTEASVQRNVSVSITQTSVTSANDAVAIYDYEKAEANELDLIGGEQITNIEFPDSDWWIGTNFKGETGLFPRHYVELSVSDKEQEVPAPSLPATSEEPMPALAKITAFDYFYPTIEAVFQILGSEGPKVNLLLILDFSSDLPGFFKNPDGSPDESSWGGQIPDHIEEMKSRYTALSGNGARVDVLWQTVWYEAHFQSCVGEFEDAGWNVVKVQDTRSFRRKRVMVTFRRRSMGTSEAHRASK